MLMVNYKPSAFFGHEDIEYFGVTILIFRNHVTSSERDHRTRRGHFPTGSRSSFLECALQPKTQKSIKIPSQAAR